MTDSVPIAVIPVLMGPLQVLLALVPVILAALGSALLALFRPQGMKLLLRLLWRLKIPLFVLAGFIWGTAKAIEALASERNPATRQEGAQPEARPSKQEWAMFRGGLTRRGAVLDGRSPTGGGRNWTFKPDAGGFYSSPAILGNQIYITSADYGVFDDVGAVICLDADTGKLVWSVTPDRMRSTFSSPSISEDGRRLVVGEGLHFTEECRIFCLDISKETLAGNQGQPRVLWTFKTQSHVESSPSIYRDRVVIGAGDDGYYCLGIEPDEKGNARVLWHADGKRFPDSETSPAVSGGKAIFGLGVGGNALCCVDVETGRQLWRCPTPYPVFTPPSVMPGINANEGRLFFGMGVGDLVNPAETVSEQEAVRLAREGATASEIADARKRLRPAGEIWCLRLSDGEKIWSTKTERTVLGAVAIAGDKLYCGSRDGHIYCLARDDGKIIRRFDAHAPIVSSPACTEDLIAFITAKGMLYVLNIESFDILWSNRLGGEGMFVSSPAITRGRVYIGSEKYGLHCLGRPVDSETKNIWHGHLSGPGHQASLGQNDLADTGNRLWNYPAGAHDTETTETTLIRAPIAISGQHRYVPIAEGPRKGLACIKQLEGEGDTPKELWFAPAALGVWQSPATDGIEVLFMEGKQTQRKRHLRCMDSKSGDEQWRYEVSANASGDFVLYKDGILIQDQPETLTRLSRDDDKVLWRRTVGVLCDVPHQRGPFLAIAVKVKNELLVLDRDTGGTLWEVRLEHPPTAGPVINGKVIFVATAEAMEARQLVDGSLLWRSDVSGPESAFVLSDGRIAYISSTGTLNVLRAKDGKSETTIPNVGAFFPPVLMNGSVLYATENALMRYQMAEGTNSVWMDTSWFGSLTSPLVIDAGSVYFASRRRGLVAAGRLR
ncbi:MAG: PQQ-binding-like beta-propeller repeat protein [Planctomycetota bacterium]|nr:PQQ-binding-like beta-propeller repeat protein [Planctomycetota bacterium]